MEIQRCRTPNRCTTQIHQIKQKQNKKLITSKLSIHKNTTQKTHDVVLM
jgi:hypothetical protein